MRTLVVSWNDAAEEERIRCERSLVIPIRWGRRLRASARRLLLSLSCKAFILKTEVHLLDHGAGQELGVACVYYPDLSHHLANDDLDMLIVDVNTLHTVGPLNLSDEVVMDCLNAENCKDVVRVLSTFGELCALGDSLTLLNLQAEA